MKKLVKSVLAMAVGAVFCAASAQAATLAQVGQADELIMHSDGSALSTDGNAGVSLAEEGAWVSSVLGYSVNVSYQLASTASDWEQVIDSPDLWANDLGTEPAYYMLRLGVGNTGADEYYLFRNLSEFQWAVISLSEISSIFDETKNQCSTEATCKTFNLGRISHISTVGEVPLPGTLGLLGLGLAGLGAVRRKKA